MTRIVRIKKSSDPILRGIAHDLKKGELVVFPTETVYGLGANALNPKAVEKIFKAKGRPMDNPLIVHIAQKKDVKKLAKKISKTAEKLMRCFWPGPLTLLLQKTKKVPVIVTAGLPTVAIRMPSHPIARSLIQLAGVPIAAPSANIAGKPSPTHAVHAFEDLVGKATWIIDSGSAWSGVESTILDVTHDPPLLLRPGAVTKEQIEKAIGRVDVHSIILNPEGFANKKTIALAPGMKYRHYAPKASVWLVSSFALPRIVLQEQKKKKKLAVITRQKKFPFAGCKVFRFFSLQKMAKELFHVFRVCDWEGTDLILVESTPEKGIGLALKNRLEKAATRIIE